MEKGTRIINCVEEFDFTATHCYPEPAKLYISRV